MSLIDWLFRDHTIHLLHRIEQRIDRMSNEIADLNAAVAALANAVTAAVDEIKLEADKLAAAASAPVIDPVAIESAATTINGLASTLTAAVTAAQGATATPAA